MKGSALFEKALFYFGILESDDKNGTIEEKTQRRKKHEGGDSCSRHGTAAGGYFEYKCTVPRRSWQIWG